MWTGNDVAFFFFFFFNFRNLVKKFSQDLHSVEIFFYFLLCFFTK